MSFSPVFAVPVYVASAALLIILALWCISYLADENR